MFPRAKLQLCYKITSLKYSQINTLLDVWLERRPDNCLKNNYYNNIPLNRSGLQIFGISLNYYLLM